MALDVNVHDNVIPIEFRKKIWDYINCQKWYATWKPVDTKMYEYIPNQITRPFVPAAVTRMPHMWMHRTCFASDDASLEKNHPLIYSLWQLINNQLGNQYHIAGPDEDMSYQPKDNPEWQPPAPSDPKLKPGWRVYAAAQLNEHVKRSHGVHRDNIDMDDSTTRTVLYVANLVWYPTWFAENIFYPDDETGSTGDFQQYQKERFGQRYFGQSRKFNVGWADYGKIVSPVPGRIIDYDGRTLHTTRPAAIWAEEVRKVIAFRVRKKIKHT